MADAVYRKKILSIDDNRQIAEILKPKLEQVGYQFDSAYSGQEGLDKIRDYRPDLVILDIMMPLMDGFEVLRRIKSDDQLKDTHVIMLTGKRRREDVVKAIGLGAEDYLVKPVDLERVLEKVRKVLPV